MLGFKEIFVTKYTGGKHVVVEWNYIYIEGREHVKHLS
jgi:hypothetical protein